MLTPCSPNPSLNGILPPYNLDGKTTRLVELNHPTLLAPAALVDRATMNIFTRRPLHGIIICACASERSALWPVSPISSINVDILDNPRIAPCL